MESKKIDWQLVILVCSMIIIMIMGIRQSLGLFLEPISNFMNNGKEFFSFAIGIQAIIWGIVTFFLGIAIDKLGPQKVLAFGIVAFSSGIFLMSSPTSDFKLFSATTLMGFGLGGAGMATMVSIAGKVAPINKRSLAMGLVAAAASFGQFAVVIPTMWMNKEFGWEISLIVLGSISASLLLLLPLLNNTNEKNSNIKDFGNSLQKTVMFSLKEKNYILLISGFFVCGFHVTFIGLHLPVDLMSKGISAEVAGWSLAIIGVTNIIGTLGFGWLGGKVKKPMPLSIIYLLRSLTITIFVLSPPSPFIALLFGAVIGILWLATVPMTNAIILSFIGPKYLATLSGICFICHQLGAVLGAWLGGRFFDIYGSYENMWWLSVALGIIAFLLTVTVNEEPFSVNSEIKKAG
ncbi:MFS transporter [Alphaproteobacteria bacterium]|nr:MFS transporter [Alphaproteobacteria bacterium]MDC1023118.1 MFS transporter [Alphaproteobacteria bacterium]